MASQALPHQVKFYISYYDTSGYQSRLELLTAGSLSSPVCHFLANEESAGPLCVTGHRDSLHSHTCLNVYASTATLSVFDDAAEGTWVLPPGLSPGSTSILDRIPVKCSSNDQEIAVQLRPGDQILSKGGRWSIDILARQDLILAGQKKVSKHPHYAQLDIWPYHRPAAPPSEFLHRVLQLNEPSRSIGWARSAYCEAKDAVVPQVSLCQHYKSTFGSYGSLISPLILLKAVKLAFPLTTTGRGSNRLEFVMRGIQLREDGPHILPMVHDKAEGTASPRLKEIHFDAAEISPDILQGLETPIWEVKEDSQAIQALDGLKQTEVYEECNAIDECTLAQPSQVVSSISISCRQHVEGTLQPSDDSTLRVEVTHIRRGTARESSKNHSPVTRSISEDSKLDSKPRDHTSYEVEAKVNATSNKVVRENKDESTSTAHRKSYGEDSHGNITTRSKRSSASSNSVFRSKKPKTSHNPSLEDLELDEDTIVVESRSTSMKNRPTNADTSLPQPQSETRSQESQPLRRYSGEPPRVVFSSTTQIVTKKNTMAFFRECGGKVVKSISTATMLCVGSNTPLKKTPNFVLAVCLGLDIVTEKWLVESQRKGFLLNPELYLPKDREREREWRFKLHEAIARGRLRGGLSGLLNGLDVYFTQGLKSLLGDNFRDFGTVATCLGADAVRNGLPNGKEKKPFLILGTADDPQTLRASRMGHKVWSKDLLVMGALRGTIQRTDEFGIAGPM